MEQSANGVLLLLIVAVAAVTIGIIARIWKRPSSLPRFRLISTLSLGSRERLVEVQHGEETLVLGVTSHRITVIDRRTSSVDGSRGFQSEAKAESPFTSTSHVMVTLYALFISVLMLAVSGEAVAQNIPLFESVPSKGGSTNYSVPVQTVILLTALSFLPAMLMLMTFYKDPHRPVIIASSNGVGDNTA